MVDITAPELSNKQEWSEYSAATMLTQYPDTHHLLAVDFDAEKRNVVEKPGGWKVLSFDHMHTPGFRGNYYSAVRIFGAEQQIAAPGSRHWMPQLLPAIYDYDPRGQSKDLVRTNFTGLVGSLPILFALPAFSAPPNLLSKVLTNHLGPNSWIPHHYPHGRKFHKLLY